MSEEKIFDKKSINRAKTSKFSCLWLWLFPTYKYKSDGFNVYFKKVKDKTIIINMEKIK